MVFFDLLGWLRNAPSGGKSSVDGTVAWFLLAHRSISMNLFFFLKHAVVYFDLNPIKHKWINNLYDNTATKSAGLSGSSSCLDSYSRSWHTKAVGTSVFPIAKHKGLALSQCCDTWSEQETVSQPTYVCSSLVTDEESLEDSSVAPNTHQWRVQDDTWSAKW